jgi:hypothetical protein
MNFRLYWSSWYPHFVCYAFPLISFTNTIFMIDMLTVPQALIVLEQFSQSQNAIIWPMHWSILSYRRATSTLSKDFKTTFPSLWCRVVLPPLPDNQAQYRHMIFVAEHTATCRGTSSDFVPTQWPRLLCPSVDGPLVSKLLQRSIGLLQCSSCECNHGRSQMIFIVVPNRASFSNCADRFDVHQNNWSTICDIQSSELCLFLVNKKISFSHTVNSKIRSRLSHPKDAPNRELWK